MQYQINVSHLGFRQKGLTTRNDQSEPGKRTIILVNKQEPFYYISVYYTLIDSSKQPKIIEISFEIYKLDEN